MASRFVLPLADVGKGISPSDGAKLDFFTTGTSNRKNTFNDEALTIKNANPVIADGNGVFPDIWLPDNGRYKVILKNKNNVVEDESDPVIGGLTSGRTLTYKTIALAIASIEGNLGDFVITLEYNAGTSKGGNTYKIVAGGTGTPDGGEFFNKTDGSGFQLNALNSGVVNVFQFGALGDGSADDTVNIQAAFDSSFDTIYVPAGIYIHSATMTITISFKTVYGDGSNSILRRNDGTFGDSVVVSRVDPTTDTIIDVSFTDMKIDSSVEMATPGALLKFTEAANCYITNVSLQNGFIGLLLEGLRASFIDNLFIRSGTLFSGVLANSRFCLIQDSPNPQAFSENVEVFFSNFNFETNDAVTNRVEHGLEIKEADGIWFSNGHLRGASVSNCFINGASSPQIFGLKFDNVWFDGNTTRCLLMDGTPVGAAGDHIFNSCTFTGGTTHGVEIAEGSTVGTVLFSGCQTAFIDSTQAWRFDGGTNITVDGCHFRSINLGSAGGASCILVGPSAGLFTMNGGSIRDTGKLSFGIRNTGTAQTTISGVAFQGFNDVNTVIELDNLETTIFATSGCTTDQTDGYVLDNPQRGEELNLLDDTAVFVTIGEILGGILAVNLKFNQTAGGFISLETADPAATSIIAGQSNLEVTTGVLTGTTGTNGKFTVSITDAGLLYFENRTGVTRNVVWRMILRDFD